MVRMILSLVCGTGPRAVPHSVGLQILQFFQAILGLLVQNASRPGSRGSTIMITDKIFVMGVLVLLFLVVSSKYIYITEAHSQAGVEMANTQ